jgi:hypothetical protein
MMLFKELLRLKTDKKNGCIPLAVLQRLRLPMPDDVLEQFLADHGVKHEFQKQYGDLDLHGLHWRLILTPAAEIFQCSVYPGFQEWFDAVHDRTLEVPKSGWKSVLLRADGKQHWQDHRTWKRAPLMIKGDLIGSPCRLHLIEGHTRTGALKGLVDSGWLLGTSEHEIWLASKVEDPDPDTSWQDTLRAERIPFADWLVYRTPDRGDLGRVSSGVLSAMCDDKLVSDDLAAVLAFMAHDPQLARHADIVRDEYARWERETMK